MGKGAGTTRNSSAASPNGVGTQAMAVTGGGSNIASQSLSGNMATDTVNKEKKSFEADKKELQNKFKSIAEFSKKDSIERFKNLSEMHDYRVASLENVEYYLNKKGIKTEQIKNSYKENSQIFVDTTGGISFKVGGTKYQLFSESSYPLGSRLSIRVNGKDHELGFSNYWNVSDVFRKISEKSKDF